MEIGAIFWFTFLFLCGDLGLNQVSSEFNPEDANLKLDNEDLIYDFPQEELNALWDLYIGTDGDHWDWSRFGNSTPWNFSQPNPNPCVENWEGITCTSDCTDIPCYVSVLVLDGMRMNGTITSSLSNLTYLSVLKLDLNNLHGTIPPQLGEFSLLEKMFLSGNNLTGTIPAALANLPTIKVLGIGMNQLTGTVPSEIFQMRTLSYINVNRNMLRGTIPNNLSAWENLNDLYFDSNQFSGTIPASIANISQLVHLGLWGNMLTGTIPEELCSLRFLLEFDVDQNRLTGTVPPELGQLSNLRVFYVPSNLLTGTIPTSLSRLTHVTLFSMGSNFFSGTIPPELSNLTSILSAFLFSNRLTGTIPPSLADWTHLLTLDLYYNQLTGTIPTTIGYKNESWGDIQLFNNQLTGPIPDGVGNLKYIRFLTLNDNFLSGTIPQNFSNYEQLFYVDLSRNILSGTVSGLFYDGKDILSILLSDNVFNGNLNGFINPLVNDRLQEYDLSSNQLTGTIPPNIFNFTNLNFAILAVNCFTGTIPSSICDAKRLATLILDGLHSSTACMEATIFGTNFIRNAVHGSIPECIFNISHLNMLHLSGNSLSGSISVGYGVSAKLSELYLSHNFLKGTIPDLVWKHQGYDKVDLSFNALSGTIPDNVYSPNNEQLSLQANRLSGTIPKALRNATNINILDGNLFDCNFNKGSLPQNDPNYNWYTCGSDSMDTSFIIWVIVVLTIVPVLIYLIRYMPQKDVVWFLSWDIYDETKSSALKDLRLTHINSFAWNVDKLLTLLYAIVFIAVVIIMPTYVALSHYYGTITIQYIWQAAMAFLTGWTAACIMLGIFMLFMMGLILHSTLMYQAKKEDEGTTRYYLYKYGKRKMTAYLLWVGLIDIVLITTVNMLYVAALGIGLNYILITAIAIALSVFKLVWTNWVIIGYFGDRLARVHNTLFSEEFRAKYLLALSIFNNILGPYLAEAFISTNCFYYLVSNAPTITSTFKLLTCYIEQKNLKFERTGCSISYAESVEFSPPFQYSYECSSSVITSFAYIFVYRYLISGILVPSVVFLLRYYEEILRKEGKTTENSEIYAWIVWCLPFLLRPDIKKANSYKGITSVRNMIAPKNVEDSGFSDLQGSDLLSIANIDDFEIPENGFSLSQPPGRVSTVPPNRAEPNNKPRIFSFPRETDQNVTQQSMSYKESVSYNEENAKTDAIIEQSLTAGRYNNTYFVVSIVGDFAVLMTFGILFPPLAFIVAISIYVEIMLMEGMIGRLVQLAVDDKDLRTLVMAMNEEFQNMNQIVWSAMDWVYIITALFWAYSLFDTLGDSVGVLKAWWIAFVMGTSPLWLKAFFVTLKRYYINRWENLNIDVNSEHDSKHISLRSIPSPQNSLRALFSPAVQNNK